MLAIGQGHVNGTGTVEVPQERNGMGGIAGDRPRGGGLDLGRRVNEFSIDPVGQAGGNFGVGVGPGQSCAKAVSHPGQLLPDAMVRPAFGQVNRCLRLGWRCGAWLRPGDWGEPSAKQRPGDLEVAPNRNGPWVIELAFGGLHNQSQRGAGWVWPAVGNAAVKNGRGCGPALVGRSVARKAGRLRLGPGMCPMTLPNVR